MSLLVLKPGLLDTIQDRGRFGYAHLGINPTGVMDISAMSVSNLLVGNKPDEAVLEMHFPAPRLRFESAALFALTGADFDARLDGQVVPVHTPVVAAAGTALEFRKPLSGARCYLSVSGGFEMESWLGSRSTNLAVQAGGFHGRALQTDDVLPFRRATDYGDILKGKKIIVFPWKADVRGLYPGDETLRFFPGAEYEWLTPGSKERLVTTHWKITPHSDRMGYRIEGPALDRNEAVELVSSAVVPGTIQLLPNGQFIILMADSQTTGGYPRIGHVIGADMPGLAQMRVGEVLRLQQVDLQAAEAAKAVQIQGLLRMRWGIYFALHAV
ncbi:MAG: biotin-dependent carboxyltransferase family protein [Thermoanaerobaculia bacterium]|nr:biotin-dependent carboxyltransferase family protein [Thermoanaerobaculia bacterium]